MSALRILLLEDDDTDAQLVKDYLEASQFDCEIIRAQTRAEFLTALKNSEIGLILADYQLPSFDGLSALEFALSIRPDLPFILVSGKLGEETAIEALKRGATDYILKTRLSRLVPSVQRALREYRERAERKKAEDALSLSEMYLAEAQRLSQTGSFGWDLSSGEIDWSDETYRIFDCERGIRPTMELVISRTHPDDRIRLKEVIGRASSEESDFTLEHRVVMPDGRIKYLRVVAHRLPNTDPGRCVFVGAVSDITEHRRAEQERRILREREQEIARLNRVSMMGELAASLAHEIKQPIAAVAIRAQACLRRLERKPPEIEGAREAIANMINDANRAAKIVDRNQALFSRAEPQRQAIDLNEIIREMAALLRDAASHHSISIRCELDPALPTLKADRVQLQQVLMNLMLNGIEAMKEGTGALSVTSKRSEDGQSLVSVSDAGVGLPADGSERIFEALFTTKPNGTGTGLSISRRIIESHGGRLWATANAGRGATFYFTVPSP
jgi:signal transduction histidine kinase/CheY-like chemotaxis protein